MPSVRRQAEHVENHIRHSVKQKKTSDATIITFCHCLCLDHWDYHSHSHVHPVEFDNLQESNFTELQSVQALHPPGLIRHDALRFDPENLLDPNLAPHSHVLQQPVSFPCHPTTWATHFSCVVVRWNHNISSFWGDDYKWGKVFLRRMTLTGLNVYLPRLYLWDNREIISEQKPYVCYTLLSLYH